MHDTDFIEITSRKTTAFISVTKTTMAISTSALKEIGYPSNVKLLLSKDGEKILVIPCDKAEGQPICYYEYKTGTFRNCQLKKHILEVTKAEKLPIRIPLQHEDGHLVANIRDWFEGVSNTPIRSRKKLF